MARVLTSTITLAVLLSAASSARAQSAAQCFLGATESRYGDGSRIEGNVGTNDAGGVLHLGRRSVVEAASVASADTVRLGPGSQIAAVAANVLERSRANVGQEGPVTLPLVADFCPVPALACGGEDVLVRKNKSLSLPPGSYGALVLQNGAELVIEPGTYEFCSVRGGRKAAIVSSGETVLNVQGTFEMENGSRVGAGDNGPLALINVGGGVKLGAKSTAAAVLAVPTGSLQLGRGVEWRGTFCASTVAGGPRLKLDCDSAPPTTTTTTSTSTTSTTTSSTTTSSTTTSVPTTTTSTTTTSTTTATATTSTTTSTTSTTSTTESTTTTTSTTTTSSSTTSTTASVPTTTTTASTTTTTTTVPTTTTTTAAPTTTTSSSTTTTAPTTTTTSAPPTTTTTSSPTTSSTTSTVPTTTAPPTTTTTASTTTTTTTVPTTTTTTAAPTTTTSTTTTTVPTTTTTTPTTSTTTTTLPGPLTCGPSNFLDVTATLVYEPRIVGGVFGMFLEVDYPAAVTIPGSGTAASARARFTNLIGANYRFVPQDLDSNSDGTDDRGRALVTANTAVEIPSAAIERVRFDCLSGTVVQPAQFACRPTDLSDSAGMLFPPEVAGLVSCSLTFEAP